MAFFLEMKCMGGCKEVLSEFEPAAFDQPRNMIAAYVTLFLDFLTFSLYPFVVFLLEMRS